MDWKKSTTPPPHLATVLGWYSDYYDVGDERHYQLVYYSVINNMWLTLSDHREVDKPDLWTAIIDPVVDDDLQIAS
jgi:hypothetical protein